MIIIKIFAIFLAILFSYIVYSLIIKPWLKEKCIIKDKNCLKIEYYKKDNSVLAHIFNSGYWFWYNGDDVYVYGYNTGYKCKDGFEPAYKIDKTFSIPEGYQCINTLDKVKEIYNESKVNYILHNTHGRDMSISEILNLLNEYDIINLKSN